MEHLDVAIVGAGLSGVAAAYHLQREHPQRRYAILEARERMGGTWDLFRYPGIRSDSDMYTLGFSFRPWKDPKAIADGPAILEYIEDTARAHGIDRKVRYRHRMVKASWSSTDRRWTLDLVDPSTGEARQLTASFLYSCAGYYSYEKGHAPDFPGRDRFRGRVVHPQFWTEDLDYTDRRVVVIGRGATAVALVPSLAERAAHVVMLQRSPTYVISRPASDKVADWLREHAPARLAYALVRAKNVALGMAFYEFCRRRPALARRLLLSQVERSLGGSVPLRPHFEPRYAPWDQRLCLVPDADLFRSLQQGRAEVVTDHIETFTERGILLRSGRELEADLIVTATGLELRLFGGAELLVDGEPRAGAETMVYKGTLVSDVPNLAFAVGYTNASWTLKSELSSRYVCRLLRHMDRHGHRVVVPRRDPGVREEPLIDFSSGYVQRALSDLPRQGSRLPWKLYQNYVLDQVLLRALPVRDPALEFS